MIPTPVASELYSRLAFCTSLSTIGPMASKNVETKEDVYERLKAHKRGDESFSETLDRLLHGLGSEWRTNVGFLTDEEADDLEAEVARGLEDADDAFDELGDEVDDRLSVKSRSSLTRRFSLTTPVVATRRSPTSLLTTRRSSARRLSCFPNCTAG